MTGKRIIISILSVLVFVALSFLLYGFLFTSEKEPVNEVPAKDERQENDLDKEKPQPRQSPYIFV